MFGEAGGEQEWTGEGEGEQVLREGGESVQGRGEKRKSIGGGRRARGLGERGERECWARGQDDAQRYRKS